MHREMLVFPSRIILRSGRRLANILFGQQQQEEEEEAAQGDEAMQQVDDANTTTDDETMAEMAELEDANSSPPSPLVSVRRSTRSLRRSSRGKQQSVHNGGASTSTSSRNRRGIRVGSWKRTSTRTKKKKISKAKSNSGNAAVLTNVITNQPEAKTSRNSNKRKKRTTQSQAGTTSTSTSRKKTLIVQEALIIDLLPDDLLDGPVLDALGFKDLCRLSLVCRRFEDAVNGGSRRWTTLYRERWGQPGAITTEASKLAGGWKKLYKAKHLAEKESNPWIQPCEHEVQAMLNHLAAFTTNTTTSNTNNSNGTSKSGDKVGTAGGVGSAAAAAAPPSDAKMTVTFLVDGSGSVTEEDFSTMTTFMTKAVQTVNAHTCEKSMFGVLQFSNEVREELTLSHITTREFDKFAKQLSRMNGGTNIALALSRACRMVKSAATAVSNPSSVEEIDLSEESNANATTNAAASITAESDAVVVGAQEVPHLVILLTDGRVDSYQAREAVSRAEMFASEVPGVTFFAFAVGRSVDKQELTKIVKTTCNMLDPKAYETRAEFQIAREEIAETRVMGLRTLDEPPW
jgi:hypothetical protein